MTAVEHTGEEDVNQEGRGVASYLQWAGVQGREC